MGKVELAGLIRCSSFELPQFITMLKCCDAPLAPKSQREIGLKNEGLQKWKRQLTASISVKMDGIWERCIKQRDWSHWQR